MGYKHSRDDILEAAMRVVIDDGLSQLTFGRLAKRLAINDRTIVYYFPTKNDLVGAVLLTLGARLQEVLASAFTSAASNHLELARLAWPVLADPDVDPVLGVFFELAGLAAAGRTPYREFAPTLLDVWVEWLASLLDGTDRERHAEAEAAVALIDGLLLFRQLSGPAAANRAARQLGVM